LESKLPLCFEAAKTKEQPMTTVDLRTQFDGDAVDLRPDDLFGDNRFAEAIERNGPAAARGAVRQALPSLTFDVEGEFLTFGIERGRLVVRRDATDDLVVKLDGTAFSDLIQNVASTFGVHMTGRAVLERGSLDAFVEWEPMLRCLLDGRAVYEPGTIDFKDRRGDPLDLRQSFTTESAPEEMGHFLAEAGFLHIEAMFTEPEMAAVSAELDAAIATAEVDDGASWWARTADAEAYPARILGFNQKSPTLRDLLRSDRFASIGSLTDDQFVQRDPSVGDSAEGLLKKVGVVEGISDVSWHKDCSMGGHSRHCCGLIVGISVTGANRENGELGVVPGSHRANIAPLGVEGLDLRPLALPTLGGDVTVHCSCTLHMSRPPVSAERRVVYTGFGLAPRSGDTNDVVDPADARRQRAVLNDHVRSHQREPKRGRVGSYEL
jgi:hypothetical protein